MENKYIYQLNKSFYKKLSKEIQLLFKLSPKDFKELTNYEGTYGFSTSIYNACRKLHKDKIAKYYYKLSDSEDFDDIIVKKLITAKTRKIFVPKSFDSSKYYRDSYKDNKIYLQNISK